MLFVMLGPGGTMAVQLKHCVIEQGGIQRVSFCPRPRALCPLPRHRKRNDVVALPMPCSPRAGLVSSRRIEGIQLQVVSGVGSDQQALVRGPR